MSNARQASNEKFKRLYQALRNDEGRALADIIKNEGMDVNETLAVYRDTYEPVEPTLANMWREITFRTLPQMAVGMGHVHCLRWLLFLGADRDAMQQEIDRMLPMQETKRQTKGTLFAHKPLKNGLVDNQTNYFEASQAMLRGQLVEPDDVEFTYSQSDSDSEEESTECSTNMRKFA